MTTLRIAPDHYVTLDSEICMQTKSFYSLYARHICNSTLRILCSKKLLLFYRKAIEKCVVKFLLVLITLCLETSNSICHLVYRTAERILCLYELFLSYGICSVMFLVFLIILRRTRIFYYICTHFAYGKVGWLLCMDEKFLSYYQNAKKKYFDKFVLILIIILCLIKPFLRICTDFVNNKARWLLCNKEMFLSYDQLAMERCTVFLKFLFLILFILCLPLNVYYVCTKIYEICQRVCYKNRSHNEFYDFCLTVCSCANTVNIYNCDYYSGQPALTYCEAYTNSCILLNLTKCLVQNKFLKVLEGTKLIAYKNRYNFFIKSTYMIILHDNTLRGHTLRVSPIYICYDTHMHSRFTCSTTHWQLLTCNFGFFGVLSLAITYPQNNG